MKRLIPTELKLTYVVAEREYRLVTKNGRKRKVIVRFGKPRRLPAHAGWYCVYKIEGLEQATKPEFSPGVDSVQAIFIAMQMAWIELFATEAFREGRLTFWGIPNLGLPPLYHSFTERPREPRAKGIRARPPRGVRRSRDA